MAISAKEAKAKTDERIREALKKQRFDYLYPNYASEIDGYIKEAICQNSYSTTFKLDDWGEEFYSKLKTFYEDLGYIVAIGNIDWTCGDVSRQVALKWY